MNYAKSNYLVKLSGIGTTLFLITGVIATIQSAFEIIYVIVSLTMFSIGVLLGMRAFAQSVSKSRYEIITTIDLIKLPKATPQKIKVVLYGSLAIEVIGSIALASMQPSSNFAFGVLASLFALGSLNMWAIINTGGSTNLRHQHGNSTISGAYYVRAPENCGDIVFYDPRPAPVYTYPKALNPNLLNAQVNGINPKEGALVLFPSYLDHSVNENLSNEERIVISFNITIQVKSN